MGLHGNERVVEQHDGIEELGLAGDGCFAELRLVDGGEARGGVGCYFHALVGVLHPGGQLVGQLHARAEEAVEVEEQRTLVFCPYAGQFGIGPQQVVAVRGGEAEEGGVGRTALHPFAHGLFHGMTIAQDADVVGLQELLGGQVAKPLAEGVAVAVARGDKGHFVELLRL